MKGHQEADGLVTEAGRSFGLVRGDELVGVAEEGDPSKPDGGIRQTLPSPGD